MLSMRGLYKIWFIGDEFSNNTFATLGEMRNDDHTPASFTYQNFEVRDFISSHFSTNESSPLGHIRSNLIKALNEHNTLPKLLVVVLDDDITKITKHLTEPSVTATPSPLALEGISQIH